MSKARIIVIIEQHIRLASVTVPPFALRLEIGIRIAFSSVVGFSNTGWSMNPQSSSSRMFVLRAHIEFEQIH